MIMNYGNYNRFSVEDIFVKSPVTDVLKTSLKKRVIGEKTDVYRLWLMFLKRKTLMDEYMIYTSVLAEQAVEFDSYERLRAFCNEYSKFRIVLPTNMIYVNWLELYDEEFLNFVTVYEGKLEKSKKTFWNRVISFFSLGK